MSGNNWSNWPSQDQPNKGYYNYPTQQPQQRIANARMQNDSYQAPSYHYQNQSRQHYSMQQQQQQNYMMHPQSTFPFNANANVFVPRNFANPSIPAHPGYSMQQQPQQSYYGQQFSGNAQFQPNYCATASSSYNMMFGQEDTGNDAFAQFGQQSQQYMPSHELAELMYSCKNSALLNEIQVGCEQLISECEEDSGTWSTAIRQRFEDKEMDDESKRVGVKLIVEMALSMEPNQFRGTDPQYTFSNLLKTLSFSLKDFLRKIIFPVLGEFHAARKQLENDSRVFMAVFYAEVFVKLTLENGSRFDKLGEALVDQIDEILKFAQKDEYMKCLLRAFKVSGAELDASEVLRKRVDQILTIMGGFANGSPVLGESVKAQILSLIECRQRGWDRLPAGAEASSASKFDQDSLDESTDNDLTEEERQFLESHLEQSEKKDGEEEEIDEQEVMNEFGKFVKEELWQAEERKTTDMMTNLNIDQKDN